MSACISRQGEYSDHVPGSGADRFLCQRCYVFDEDDALAALKVAEADSARLREQLEAVRAALRTAEKPGAEATDLYWSIRYILSKDEPGHSQ